MDGKFSFTQPTTTVHLSVSYVGYKPQEIELNANGKNFSSVILMQAEEQQLEDVKIYSGQNPAERIIKEVLKHRDENDPTRLKSYSYSAYNKFIYTADATLSEKIKDGDSTRALFEYLKGNYLMIMESVVATKYRAPGLKKEYVEATKVSGLKDPDFSLNVSQLQPFSFYDASVSLVEKDYVNPVSGNSDNFYFFAIEDTSYSGADTIYHISFKPRKGKFFNSMKGMLYINTDGYAIQHVSAEPFDTAGLTMMIRIEQQYEKVDGVWFPFRYNTDLHYNNFLKPGLKVLMLGRTYFDNIKLNIEIPLNEFSGIVQEIDATAGSKNSEYWNTVRPDSLSEKEVKTYTLMDSLGRERHMDAKLHLIDGLLKNELPVGAFNFDLQQIIKFNAKENYRFGIGLRTNKKISSVFSVGGYGGWGLADEEWKYGANLKFILEKKYNYTLRFSYAHDYEETGGVNFYKDNFFGNTQKWRNTLVDRFDFTDRYEVSLTGRSFRFLNFQMTAFEAQRTPAFVYNYFPANDVIPLAPPFVFTGIKFSGRYAYHEKVMQSFGHEFEVNNPFPIVWFNITRGMKVLNGEFDYWKFDMKFNFEFPSKRFGYTFLQGFAGYVNAALPLSELFACKGNYTQYGLYSFSNFQTMRADEFIYDQYAAVFWEQDFGSLLFKAGKFRPKVLLSNSVAIGKFLHPEKHSVVFTSPEKIYTESGLIVNNIISRKFYGAVRLGLGAGAYYRWGYYMLPYWRDNLALKLAFYVSG